LKKLYREATRTLHPDLAADDDERARRAKFMVATNLAYEAGDPARLRAILDEWGSSPENVAGQGTGAELIRAIRRIKQIGQRLVQIDKEIAEVRSTDSFRMKGECEAAAGTGRDLLNELTCELDREIEATRSQIESLTKRVAQ
jgi:DnaJ-class molecular chaperone